MTLLFISCSCMLTFLARLAHATDYIGVAIPSTFSDAETYCINNFNSHLASIHSASDEQKAVNVCSELFSFGDKGYDFFKTYTMCWIGLDGSATNFEADVSQYTWTDGSGTPEDSYIPTVGDISGGEYAMLESRHGTLEDTDDDNLFCFICNAPRFVNVPIAKTFTDADDYCNDTHGTSLASIHSAEAHVEALALCRENHLLGNNNYSYYSAELTFCWFGLIGAGLRPNVASYVYTDGSSNTFTSNNGMGENIDGSDICAVINSNDGLWYDWFCHTKQLSFLCNRDNTSYPDFVNQLSSLPTGYYTDDPTSAPSRSPTRLTTATSVTLSTDEVTTPIETDAPEAKSLLEYMQTQPYATIVIAVPSGLACCCLVACGFICWRLYSRRPGRGRPRHKSSILDDMRKLRAGKVKSGSAASRLALFEKPKDDYENEQHLVLASPSVRALEVMGNNVSQGQGGLPMPNSVSSKGDSGLPLVMPEEDEDVFTELVQSQVENPFEKPEIIDSAAVPHEQAFDDNLMDDIQELGNSMVENDVNENMGGIPDPNANLSLQISQINPKALEVGESGECFNDSDGGEADDFFTTQPQTQTHESSDDEAPEPPKPPSED